MKTLLLTTGALALASVAAPAFAQDAAAPADTAPVATTAAYAPTDVATFTGPRAEIFGGWDRVGSRFRTYDAVGDRSTVKGHKNGGTAGALVGYDMPIGDRLVAGVFGSYALSTATTCNDVGTTYSGCLKSGRQIEGGARIGAKAMNDKALLYLKGAYVNGQLRSNFSDGTTLYKDVDNQDGWRAGAGVEYAIAKHAYVKVEYDYTRFKSYTGEIGAYDTALRFDRNQVLGGFGVRF